MDAVVRIFDIDAIDVVARRYRRGAYTTDEIVPALENAAANLARRREQPRELPEFAAIVAVLGRIDDGIPSRIELAPPLELFFRMCRATCLGGALRTDDETEVRAAMGAAWRTDLDAFLEDMAAADRLTAIDLALSTRCGWLLTPETVISTIVDLERTAAMEDENAIPSAVYALRACAGPGTEWSQLDAALPELRGRSTAAADRIVGLIVAGSPSAALPDLVDTAVRLLSTQPEDTVLDHRFGALDAALAAYPGLRLQVRDAWHPNRRNGWAPVTRALHGIQSLAVSLTEIDLTDDRTEQSLVNDAVGRAGTATAARRAARPEDIAEVDRAIRENLDALADIVLAEPRGGLGALALLVACGELEVDAVAARVARHAGRDEFLAPLSAAPERDRHVDVAMCLGRASLAAHLAGEPGAARALAEAGGRLDDALHLNWWSAGETALRLYVQTRAAGSSRRELLDTAVRVTRHGNVHPLFAHLWLDLAELQFEAGELDAALRHAHYAAYLCATRAHVSGHFWDPYPIVPLARRIPFDDAAPARLVARIEEARTAPPEDS